MTYMLEISWLYAVHIQTLYCFHYAGNFSLTCKQQITYKQNCKVSYHKQKYHKQK